VGTVLPIQPIPAFIKLSLPDAGPSSTHLAQRQAKLLAPIDSSSVQLLYDRERPQKLLDTMSPTSDPINLLDLPAEVTRMIWRPLLTTNCPIRLCPYPEPLFDDMNLRGQMLHVRDFEDKLQIDPRFLGACRRIYEEGTQWLYSENIYHFVRISGLRANGPLRYSVVHMAKLLQHVQFLRFTGYSVGESVVRSARKLCESCTKLKQVVVHHLTRFQYGHHRDCLSLPNVFGTHCHCSMFTGSIVIDSDGDIIVDKGILAKWV
jgi:hypothetical protein